MQARTRRGGSHGAGSHASLTLSLSVITLAGCTARCLGPLACAVAAKEIRRAPVILFSQLPAAGSSRRCYRRDAGVSYLHPICRQTEARVLGSFLPSICRLPTVHLARRVHAHIRTPQQHTTYTPYTLPQLEFQDSLDCTKSPIPFTHAILLTYIPLSRYMWSIRIPKKVKSQLCRSTLLNLNKRERKSSHSCRSTKDSKKLIFDFDPGK